MAPRVKQTARKRTLQIEGFGFPWVQPVLPLEFYANHAGIKSERRYIFVQVFTVEISTEAIKEVLELPEVHNDRQTDVASLHMKVDIWDSIERVSATIIRRIIGPWTSMGIPRPLTPSI
ncbi:OLC1v1036626C1 [Oldenlandia corymbosa var. corymbosa]|uniref:OLC1v1036626C1 n=1 Tax=Oldenlandia corymbosa var. corymbosa TaxID=529605 RepID=A0AAV1CZD6_OLDCO|nr:OLC1v1036626C1 [Oldenlandia corymbosa var. corymbosa]